MRDLCESGEGNNGTEPEGQHEVRLVVIYQTEVVEASMMSSPFGAPFPERSGPRRYAS